MSALTSLNSWDGSPTQFSGILDDLNRCLDCPIPMGFLKKTLKALITQDWAEVSEAFVRREFISETGHFLIAGPYVVRRKGVVSEKMSLAFGRILPLESTPDPGEASSALFGLSREIPNPVIPVEILIATGNLKSDEGEAFIVPDGWKFPGSERGPALNNMLEQSRRFKKFGIACLNNIFNEESANLLVNALSSGRYPYSIQALEYYFHENGHAAGLGLRNKLSTDLLMTPWYRGVEEWRSDGVEFELAARTLVARRAGAIVAANLALRFGIDAQRSGGMERDTDVNASLLTFDRLLESGAFKIDGNRKLAFVDPTYEGLVQATSLHKLEACQLTRDELSLQHPQGLWGLYGSIRISRATRNLFQGLVVDPCNHLQRSLQ